MDNKLICLINSNNNLNIVYFIKEFSIIYNNSTSNDDYNNFIKLIDILNKKDYSFSLRIYNIIKKTLFKEDDDDDSLKIKIIDGYIYLENLLIYYSKYINLNNKLIKNHIINIDILIMFIEEFKNKFNINVNEYFYNTLLTNIKNKKYKIIDNINIINDKKKSLLNFFKDDLYYFRTTIFDYYNFLFNLIIYYNKFENDYLFNINGDEKNYEQNINYNTNDSLINEFNNLYLNNID